MIAQSSETPTEHLITGEELLRVGDIGKCELVAGKIIRFDYNKIPHGIGVSNIAGALDDFVRPRRIGRVMIGGVGIYTRRNPDTVRGADVLFISNERYARLTSQGYLDVAPELVVEVMSPDDRWGEIKRKLQEYFSIGVRLIWVADPADRTVSAYRSMTDVREFGEDDALPGDDVLPGFSVPVASSFEE
jgi:Uma2 family endonuclease